MLLGNCMTKTIELVNSIWYNYGFLSRRILMTYDSLQTSALARVPLTAAAALAGVSERHLRRAVRTGDLRHVWVGRYRRPMTTRAWVSEWQQGACA